MLLRREIHQFGILSNLVWIGPHTVQPTHAANESDSSIFVIFALLSAKSLFSCEDSSTAADQHMLVGFKDVAYRI